MVCWHKPCTYLALTLTLSPNGPKKIPHDPRHLAVPSCASKMISEPLVCSTQTVHLSCVKIDTIYKQTEMRFHLSLITYEYHRLRPKWFLRLWYAQRKPCSYHAATLTVSPNTPEWDSTWPTLPRSSIVCVQNDFRAFVTLGTNHAPTLTLSPNRKKTRFHMTHVTKEFNRVHPN
jgi:hypothetical protein